MGAMDKKSPPFQKFVFICENVRKNGEVSCGPKSMGSGYVEKLKEYVKAKGLKGKIRVCRTGCMDVCSQGPNILIYPEGRWYSQVSETDLEEIIQKELIG